MKMVAVQCIKFLRLKRRLRLPSWQVVGLLESVWLFTQSNAPAGDIGKHSDEDIAAHIEWDGDAEQLVKDLVECGWLDRHETHRLVVHDWHEHAPNYVKGNMAKHGKGFVTVESVNSAREAPREVAKDAPRDGAVAACSTPVSTHHPRVGLGRDSEQNRTEQIGDDGLAKCEAELPDLAAAPVDPIDFGSKMQDGAVFTCISDGLLGSPSAVCSWFRRQLSTTAPVLPGNRAALVLTLCAARAAVMKKDANSKAAYFASLVSGRKWNGIKRHKEVAIKQLQEVLP